jgi:hypothetical protein
VSPLTAIYLDFQDRFCYRAWRWLSLLPERGWVEIRPYSVDAGRSWDRTGGSWGLELLALGELARETGRSAHEALVDAAFAAVHDSAAEEMAAEAWLAIGAAGGLDLDTFTADSERWRAEVGLWHAEAEDELGVRGVPTLVFGEAHALYVRLEEEITEAEAGQRLLADLADLAEQPVELIRRTA